jgi:hypothetical protein
MTTTGKNRIMIFGPKADGTYVVEFRTAEGEALAISVPASETRVLKHFQKRIAKGRLALSRGDRYRPDKLAALLRLAHSNSAGGSSLVLSIRLEAATARHSSLLNWIIACAGRPSFRSCNPGQLATSDRQNLAGNPLHYTMATKVFCNPGQKLIRTFYRFRS